jgi:hypothetical protein
MKTRHLLLVALLSALAFGAQAKLKRVDYAAYAGEPIPEFRYSHLYNWQRTSGKSLVVWTKPSKAYLLTLRHNCDAMAGRFNIRLGGVDSIERRVRAGSDNVEVGQLTCKIDTIQPLDLARMKAERA